MQELETELAEIRQGKRVLAADGTESLNDMYHENVLLQVAHYPASPSSVPELLGPLLSHLSS